MGAVSDDGAWGCDLIGGGSLWLIRILGRRPVPANLQQPALLCCQPKLSSKASSHLHLSPGSTPAHHQNLLINLRRLHLAGETLSQATSAKRILTQGDPGINYSAHLTLFPESGKRPVFKVRTAVDAFNTVDLILWCVLV